MNTAQQCVEFLKQNGVGVATFIGVDKMERWKTVCRRPLTTYVLPYIMSIGELPKLCVKITIFMQGHVLIADWCVAHFVVVMNDVMNDNMAAFAHVGARLGAFCY